MPRPGGQGRPEPLPRLLWTLVLVAAAVAAFSSGLDVPFLLDDALHIAKNPVIQRPLSWSDLLGDPRAVVTATLRWNFLLGGLNPAGYHVLNMVVHALAGVLVFLLGRATLGLPAFEGRYESSATDLAGVTALLFVLHPIQVESATYIIQRAEVFVSVALVAALLVLASMKAGRTEATPRGLSSPAATGRSGLLALLVPVCLVGVYSKPSFVVLPALLLVYDAVLLPRRQGAASAMLERWPVYGVASVAALATLVLTTQAGGFEADTSGFEIEGITPADYASAQPGVIARYLGVALWPDGLCFDCGYRGAWPVHAGILGDSLLAPAAILLALALAALALRRRQPLLLLAVLASAVLLAPTSSVVPLADFYVEHRMYLPLAFVSLALVTVVHDAAQAARGRLPEPAVRRGLVVVAAAVALALGWQTVERNQLFSDPVALMEDSLRQAPQNERVHYNLANAYKRLGRLDDAVPHYRAAIRLRPGVVRSYQNLGSLYLQQGKDEEALEVYLAGARVKPEAAMAHRNVATARLRLGQAAEALAAAERSLAIEPRNVNGLRLAGDSLAAMGRHEEAERSWRAALALAPGDPRIRARLTPSSGR